MSKTLRITSLDEIKDINPRHQKRIWAEYNALQSSELAKTGVSLPQPPKDAQNASKRKLEGIRDIIIGIDTGVNTGFAVWNCREQKFERIATFMIHQAMEWVLKIQPDLVRIEDARLSRLPAKFRKDEKTEIQRLQNVGQVKRDARIWEDYLTDKNIRFEMTAPNNHIRKLTSEQFYRLTGWAKQTSNHARDAAMLVHGFTMRNLEYSLKGYELPKK